MLSYIFEFNLNVSGDEADKFLLEILQEWPRLFDQIPGFQGSLLLANAFGLAGGYTYHWRLDLDSFSSLQAYDQALKSDRPDWRKARTRWFQRRSAVKGRLLRFDSGRLEYTSHKRDGGLVHYVINSGHTLKSPVTWRGLRSVCGYQQLVPLVNSSETGGHETWVRLANLEALEEFTTANDLHITGGVVSTRLFGEIREVDGALLSGA